VAGLSFAEWMMLADSLAYLPGDILVKVDRAAMDSSLESRAPYLDPRVVRLGWSLPREARIAGGVGKRVLRTVLARHVPPQLVERPKQGFAIPLDRWLRGALRGWAEELLAPDRLAAGGLLAPGPVRHLWTEHLAGRANHGAKLWTLLMLEAWREAWLARP
jgi:asparagine synthase (glutamine-hydrolysing)